MNEPTRVTMDIDEWMKLLARIDELSKENEELRALVNRHREPAEPLTEWHRR
jgi:hypothetical protein